MLVSSHNLKPPTYTLSERSDFSIRSYQNSGIQEADMDLPVFDLSTIAKATNNFTIKNKIGEGGFGSVYRVICFQIIMTLRIGK